MIIVLVAILMLVTSHVSGSNEEASCPVASFCDSGYQPEQCIRMEKGYFRMRDKFCAGCDVCIRKDGKFKEDGCQIIGCPMSGDLEGCLEPRFYRQFYKLGGTKCDACYAITCLKWSRYVNIPT